MDSNAIMSAIESVTKKWAKQRKSEERNARRVRHRREVMTRMRVITIKQAAWEVMADAYDHASNGGANPATARQVMYARRREIQDRTGKTLDDKYFTQRLLPDYIAAHQGKTASWDVVFDARGHLREPHTGVTVPLGTVEVREYLGSNISGVSVKRVKAARPIGLFPTHGAANRFVALLLIEKEGFLPLFESVHLAERFDIAILSGKGMSSVALRTMVEQMCGTHAIPLFVLHDFDKSGFSILGTLTRDTRRYTFSRSFEVVDLGLRLADVEEYQLDDESVYIADNAKTRCNLRENGATAEEIEFLCSGRRVELNAFTSGDLVEWIEGKLVAQGVKKLIPKDEVLGDAYRRALERQYLATESKKLHDAARQFAQSVKLPAGLAKTVKGSLKRDKRMPWDMAVANAAQVAFKNSYKKKGTQDGIEE